MEIIIGAVVFGLIIIAIIVMVIINFTYRGVKKMREQIEDDHYQHLKQKEQKEKHPFGKDYFKSADDAKEKKTAETPNDSARRTTTSSDGVTIIDDRQPAKEAQKKKIFEGDEGEYVEFEEV